jgi:hypothetical protein
MQHTRLQEIINAELAEAAADSRRQVRAPIAASAHANLPRITSFGARTSMLIFLS